MKKFIEKIEIEPETKMSRGEAKVKEAKEEFKKLIKEQTTSVESKVESEDTTAVSIGLSIEIHAIAKKMAIHLMNGRDRKAMTILNCNLTKLNRFMGVGDLLKKIWYSDLDDMEAHHLMRKVLNGVLTHTGDVMTYTKMMAEED